MQLLVIKILNKLTHRPSSVKLWQIPQATPLPIPLVSFFRLLPLDAHDTSYLAASARMLSFSCILSFFILLRFAKKSPAEITGDFELQCLGYQAHGNSNFDNIFIIFVDNNLIISFKSQTFFCDFEGLIFQHEQF